MRFGNLKKQQGSILVITIWLLVFFSILCAALYKITSSQLNLSQRFEEFILGRCAADGICNYVMWELKNDETEEYDTLYELSSGKKKDMGLINSSYTFLDEESKININTMPEEVLRELPGMDEDLAKAVADSALKPFFVKEQILLLEEITEENFEQFSDFITVHSNGKVNINTASEEVLGSLGLDESLVKIIVYFRNGNDGEEATEDDGIFESTAAIVQNLDDYTGLFAEQELQLVELISKEWLDVRGEKFSLDIQVESLSGRTMEYEIVLNNNEIFQWKER